MLLLATLSLHERCIAERVGRPVDAWTVIPSTKQRAGEHPVRVVAKRVLLAWPEVELVTNEDAAEGRATEPDRFGVVAPHSAHGRHVLVVDDTWATGSRAQSAALALKSAGAEAVTVLVLARWLNPQDGTPTARFLRRAWPESYDPRLCPVSQA